MLQRHRAGHARRLSLVVLTTALGLGAFPAWSQTLDAGADALLAIDLNRATVIDRIVLQWGGLALPSGAGLDAAQLRARLSGLRADRLLAASLAGTSQGLQQVLSQAAATTRRDARLKSLGDAAVDLTYTALTPCRIIDTRNAVGPLQPGVIRTEVGYSATTFAGQGGDASNCGIPAGVAALALNVVAVNPANLGFIKLWPANAPQPNASTINYDPTTTNVATGTIVPVDGANNNSFDAESPAQVHMVVDVVGYFKSAADATAMNIQVNGQRVMRYEYNETSPNIVGGSSSNTVAAFPGQTIAGGGLAGDCIFSGVSRPCSNRTTAPFATVGGGSMNIAAGVSSIVGGGDFNAATATYATVAGGVGNTVSGNESSILGGTSNTVSGNHSTIIGDIGSTVTGDHSVAAGHDVNVPHLHTFVWNGWDFGSASSFRDDAFQIHGQSGLDVEYGARRADGGGTSWVFIGNGFAGQAIATSTEAFLSSGGMWTNSSDRNRKTDLSKVNPRDILERVTRLPISAWRYINETSGARHLGPMAQDFYASFHLGVSDTTIGTLDETGVALAAIQGLNQLMQEKDAKIDAQQREIANLRERMNQVEHALLQLTNGDGRVAMHGTP